MSIFLAELQGLSHAIRGFEISAESSYKAEDEKIWKRSIQGLVEASEELIDLLDFGWEENPPIRPGTPTEWIQSVDEAIKAFHTLRRQTRKSQGRVSRQFHNKMRRTLLKLEEATVFQARAMKDEFETSWPMLWTQKKKDKYRGWYAKKVR